MLCILYVIAVGTFLGFAGILVERVLPPTFPRRWVWCLVIPISVVLPGYYRANHTWSVGEVAEQAAPQLQGHAPGMASTIAPAAGPWARLEAYDPFINRIWLIASGILIVWGLASAWHVEHLVRRSRRERGLSAASPVIDGVPVVITKSVGPATVGLWHSRVLVPRWVLALPGAQRQYVVSHEDEHRRAHDARLLFVASLPLILLPWNLALWWQLRRLRLAVEMDCDNRVVNRLGNPSAYGEVLLKVAQAGTPGPRIQPAFLGGVGMLERRLTMLLAPTPLSHVQRFLLPAAACVLLFFVLSLPHPILTRGSHTHAAMTSSAATAPDHHGPASASAIVTRR